MPHIGHIIVARKPVVGTVAENCLTFDCGGMNIDACRIGTADTRTMMSLTAFGLMNDDGWKPQRKIGGSVCGRFPANLVLGHSEACVCKGTKRVDGSSRQGQTGEWLPAKSMFGVKSHAVFPGYADASGKETVADWACAPDCPVRVMGEQSGLTTNTRHMSYMRNGDSFIGGIPSQPERDHFVTETGTASRFFKQVQQEPECPINSKP